MVRKSKRIKERVYGINARIIQKNIRRKLVQRLKHNEEDVANDYLNKTTLLELPIELVPFEYLIIDKQYAFDIRELKKLNRLTNPYTNEPFSEDICNKIENTNIAEEESAVIPKPVSPQSALSMAIADFCGKLNYPNVSLLRQYTDRDMFYYYKNACLYNIVKYKISQVKHHEIYNMFRRYQQPFKVLVLETLSNIITDEHSYICTLLAQLIVESPSIRYFDEINYGGNFYEDLFI